MTALRVAIPMLWLFTSQALASEFTIDEWDLTSCVLQASPDIVSDYFTEVINPFTESHQVELGVSSASASYDFGWDETSGYFSIESQIAAELISDGSNIASTYGSILITPSVDLAFHVDGTMDFNLPAQVMKAVMHLHVLDAPDMLYYRFCKHDTFSDGIGSGTLSTDADFALPAGRTWTLYYDLYVDTDDYPSLPGSEGEIGTATSIVNFSFTVLPEPSTLGLLAMSGLMALRRKRA